MMEHKSISLDVAEVKFDNVSGSFTGYASVFGGVDSYGDTIHPGAYSDSVGSGLDVKMYFNHGWRKYELPIGKMHVKQDERGLRVERSEFTPGLRLADEVKAALQHRTVTGLSIGYALSDDGFKQKKDGGRDIYAIKYLKEVSIVDWPADPAAQISLKSMIDEAKSLKDVETLLRDVAGLSHREATALVGRLTKIARGERDAEMKAAAELQSVFDQFRIG